ncbi:mannosyltransferase family protein [Dictyobacter kobayashii]|uniref:Glycosyltransferase RgtA/B/C/D-like domain-containing protein n=1 Tax=Dictyobacter kobayashii TaxID=2014872 RepID=A0A402AHW6_9CHLR|nr:mannosyltransferase family protein [Dictyobacter kobayashii]GCE18708.1 hypothetical protein KDK_25080 [Dictyobacter kobayashii]
MKQKKIKQGILLTPTKPAATIRQKIVSAPDWKKWLKAIRAIFPFYLALHIGILLIDGFSSILMHGDIDWQHYPISTLWNTWKQWDTYHYLYIAVNGYPSKQETAFFPLYPLLTGFLLKLHVCSNPVVAQLIISNLAWLILMAVFYQFVKEDVNEDTAQRTVLYHSIFPTAFFLAAGYNESLLLCLVLLSFYQMRHGRWWLAGIFGFFACLTRSTGILLVIPFIYEYLSQCEFKIKPIAQLPIPGLLLIPTGLGVFMVYTKLRFNDWLSFMHVEAIWNRHFTMPWVGIFIALQLIHQSSLLSYQALRNLTDLVPDLFVLALLLAGWVGPWKLPRKDWSYLLFGTVLWLFYQFTPVIPGYPLASMGRYMLEVFPAFIVAARIGTHKGFHLNYICIALAMYAYLVIAFLSGYWVL